MSEYEFTLPLCPLLNHYYRHAVVGGKRCKPRAVTYLSDEGKEYKKAVAEALEGIAPLAGDLCLSARVFRKTRRGDIDGYSKGLLDALNGVAYTDDGQIVSAHWYLDHDKGNPRIEVKIWEATE